MTVSASLLLCLDHTFDGLVDDAVIPPGEAADYLYLKTQQMSLDWQWKLRVKLNETIYQLPKLERTDRTDVEFLLKRRLVNIGHEENSLNTAGHNCSVKAVVVKHNAQVACAQLLLLVQNQLLKHGEIEVENFVNFLVPLDRG
jgi:hypothetical protein